MIIRKGKSDGADGYREKERNKMKLVDMWWHGLDVKRQRRNGAKQKKEKRKRERKKERKGEAGGRVRASLEIFILSSFNLSPSVPTESANTNRALYWACVGEGTAPCSLNCSQSTGHSVLNARLYSNVHSSWANHLFIPHRLTSSRIINVAMSHIGVQNANSHC